MKYLNRLKNLKIYNLSGYRIKSINENLKEDNKNQVVIYKGFKENSFIDFLNSGLLYNSYFKNILVKRLYKTENNKSKLVTNVNDYKSLINTKVNKTMVVKNNISSIKDKNIIIDSSKFIDLEHKMLVSKTQDKLFNVFNNSFSKLLEDTDNYKELLYVINIDGYSKSSKEAIKMNNKDFITSIFYSTMNGQKLYSKENQNITLLFISLENSIMFRYDYNNLEATKNKFKNRLRRLIDVNTLPISQTEVSNIDLKKDIKIPSSLKKDKNFSANSLVNNDEPTEEEIEDVNNKEEELNAISNKVDEVINYIKIEKGLEIDVNDEYSISNIIEKELLDNKDLSELDASLLYNDILDKNDSFKYIKRNINNRNNIGEMTLKNTKKILSMSKKQDEYLKDLEEFKFSDDKNIDREINTSIDNINEETIQNISSNDFDKSYMEKTFNKDFVDIMKSFNEKEDIPVFVNKLEVEDSSNSQTMKNTVKVQFRSPDGLTHNVKFDVPKIIDGKMMKVNGGKKLLNKQLILLPIVKYRSDEVWITSNYGKYIIEKFGQKETAGIEWLKKLFSEDEVLKQLESKQEVNVKKGNSILINNNYLTSVIYNSISSFLLYFNNKDYTIDFNQRNLEKVIKNSKTLSEIEFDKDKYFAIGYSINKNKLLFCGISDSLLYTSTKTSLNNLDINLEEYLIQEFNKYIEFDKLKKTYSNSVKANTTMSYSRVKIINKVIPIVMVLGFYKGLTSILDLYGVDYKFVEKDERIYINDKKNKIKFRNGYLIYSTDKLRFDLLLSGLNVISTASYDFEEMDTQTPYLEYFNDKFHSRNVGKGIRNSLDLIIDPITLDILKDLKLPENIVELLLMANTMLEDVTSKEHNDMSIYRIRGPEQVNALIYNMMAQSYKEYSESFSNKNPKKMSVRQDHLIKVLMEQTTVDEISDLNPSLEIDKMTSVTFKGPAGKNEDRSYTPDMRSYSKSMQGIVGISSPDSNKVGIVRQLSYDSQMKTTRGYLDGEKENNSDTNIYTALELLNPYSSRHADKNCPL